MRKVKKLLAMLLVCLMTIGVVSTSAFAGTATTAVKKVTSVKITNANNNTVLNVKQSLTLKTSVTVVNSRVSKAVTYASSNKAVATVDSKGVVKALKKGKTTITVKSKVDPKVYAKVTITVGVRATSIKLPTKSKTLYVGNSFTNKAVISKTATIKTAKYTSSNTAVAKVDASGKITALKAGTATITAITKDGTAKKATCTIKVVGKVNSVKITNVDNNRVMKAKTTLTIKPAVSVSHTAISKAVTYTSSNKAVATVDSKGVVKALKAGKTTITVKSKASPSVYAKVTITVGTPVSSIKVVASKSLFVGKEFSLGAKVNSTATNKTLKYTTSNKAVATVSSTGKVKAIKAGTATITVKAVDGSGKTAKCVITVTNPVTGITIPATKNIFVGTSFVLGAKVNSTATNKALTYTSSDKTIATVDANGKVTALKAGTVTITAKAKDGSGKTATCKVTVTVAVSGIVVDASKSVFKGAEFNLGAKVANATATNKTLSYTSSDTTVATVDQNGKVKALKAGKTTITVKAKDGSGKTATCVITVTNPVTTITVNPKFELTVGKTTSLKASVNSDATNKNLTYSTSDAKVVTVSDSGVIVAVKAGTATITIKAIDGSNKTARVTVTVKEKVQSITITDVNDNAAIEVGEVLTFGYKFAKNDSEASENVKFSSSNVEVATVDEAGNVEGVAVGETTITVTSIASPNVSASFKVNVIPSYDGYTLSWNDEFNASALDTDVWNYEEHAPGWVNSESQAYVESEDNVYLEDGKLVIQAVKDEAGNITSGRINTQNNKTFKYGRFEIAAKVPVGAGYLPAFWMMPNDENIYGQWPKCGEIDAMEVMGQNTNKLYGTIHYGNPHMEDQGTNVITDGPSYSDEYHVFSCEWEPGKITWYVDGVKYHETQNWYSTTEGQGTLTYPAPFDQPFYVILNLAVGGSWVGPWDSTTDFNTNYSVDYVRVYQRDSYDEDVTEPARPFVPEREADELTGNYVSNGDFAENEALEEEDDLVAADWYFLNALGGVGTATIEDGKMVIVTENAGSENYSIQLCQAYLPMENGYEYEVSFDAYADEERTMIVDISAPDRGYVRYLKDTAVNLGTESAHYKYTFNMDQISDANGRIEFNLGNTESTAKVYIDNVVVKKLGLYEVVTTKTPRADGNLIYNGKFQEGEKHLGDWEIVDTTGDAVYEVSSFEDGRKLVIGNPSGAELGDVILSQSDIPYTSNVKYELSFNAYVEEASQIAVIVNGVEVYFDLNPDQTAYTYKFAIGEEPNGTDIQFKLGKASAIKLDNITVAEDSLIKNGSFNAGLSGYYVYAYTPSDITYGVDSIQEGNDNAFAITIKNTGGQTSTGVEDWHIQLQQQNVALEKGKYYTLTYKVRSDISRKFKYAIQNATTYIPYVEDTIDINTEYQTVTKTFKMGSATDLASVLCFTMGSIGGTVIADTHNIYIDDISLEEVEAPVKPEKPAGEEILTNGDLSNGSEGWAVIPNGGAEAALEVVDGVAIITTTNVGTEEWHIQFAQSGLSLETGTKYIVKYTIESNVDRVVKSAHFTNGSDGWFAGKDVTLTANTPEDVEYEINMGDNETTDAGKFQFSLGKIDGSTPDNAVIKISKLSIKKVPTGPQNILTNGDLSNGSEGWAVIPNGGAEAALEVVDGVAIITTTNVGTEEWHIQFAQSDITLETGKKYTVSYTIESNVDRVVKSAHFTNGSDGWFAGKDVTLTANTPEDIEYVINMGTNETTDTAKFQFSLGKIDGSTPDNAVIKISKLSIVEVVEEAETAPSTITVSGLSLVKDGSEENLVAGYICNSNNGGAATMETEGDVSTVTITALGDYAYSVQVQKSGLELEAGTYTLSFAIDSSVERTVGWSLLVPSGAYAPVHASTAGTLTLNEAKSVNVTFTIDEAIPVAELQINMGAY